MRTSDFSLKPIRLTVFEATPADLAAVPKVRSLRSQRAPKDFRNAVIRADRALRRDPAYVPEFANLPIVVGDLPVLSADEVETLCAVKLDLHGDNDAAALRDILFTWWEERFLAAHSEAPAIGE